MRNKTAWKKGEIPFCEVQKVDVPKKPGEPFVFHLTPRGAEEHRRREKEMKAENAKNRKWNKKHAGKNGIPIGWLLFGPFCSDGTPVFS